MDKYTLLLLAVISALICLIVELIIRYNTIDTREKLKFKAENQYKSILYKAGKVSGKVHRYINHLSLDKRNDNLVYKYISMMYVTLSSLGLYNMTSPETTFVLFCFISLIASFLLTVGLPFYLFFIVYPLCMVATHSILIFLARTSSFQRMQDLMDVESMLSTSMEDGIVIAVEKNLRSIPVSVRSEFKDFYDDVMVYGNSMEYAIMHLNMRCGHMLDNFCDKAYRYFVDADDIQLLALKENIARNAKRRILLTKQQRAYKASMLYFKIGIIGSLIFSVTIIFLLTSGIPYFFTLHGRICTLLTICSILIGFILSQFVYSGGVK